MTGGGSDLKKHTKSRHYLSKFVKITKFVFKKLAKLRLANTGSILIEFAVCMPVLIILLYYINDLTKLKRWQDQTEFVAQQMANILQNIAQKGAAEGRTISYPDLQYAASLAYLSIFPGKTNFHDKRANEFGYSALGHIFCIQGNEDSTASVLWAKRFSFAGAATKPSSVVIDRSYLNRSNIKVLSNVAPSEIYPTLKISPGEIKLILECGIFYQKGWSQFIDGRSSLSPSEVFGLKLYKLSPPTPRAGGSNYMHFLQTAIFRGIPKEFFITEPSNSG